MQTWFSQRIVGNEELETRSPSLLADWNSYASRKASEESTSGFDIEAALRSANDTVSGTFDVVSKGVRDLPGNLQSATNVVPSGKSLIYFGFLFAAGVLFIFMSFTMFIPVLVLMPQKFAICFTVGCCFIISSFFALKGPKHQLEHMLSKERLPFTAVFVGSMAGTIYVSIALHSYVLSILFSTLQVLTLVYYLLSYLPGGSTGLKFLSSALYSSLLGCFGR